jgi:hypothetical protein
LGRGRQFLELQRVEIGELEGFGKVRTLESLAVETSPLGEDQVSPMVPISPVEEAQVQLDGCRGRCARELVLRGTCVEEILPGGRAVGLEAGDLIIDYESVYHLVMEDSNFLARSGGKLLVIRKGRRVIIEFPKM